MFLSATNGKNSQNRMLFLHVWHKKVFLPCLFASIDIGYIKRLTQSTSFNENSPKYIRGINHWLFSKEGLIWTQLFLINRIPILYILAIKIYKNWCNNDFFCKIKLILHTFFYLILAIFVNIALPKFYVLS